jgi:hypothetical protein
MTVKDAIELLRVCNEIEDRIPPCSEEVQVAEEVRILTLKQLAAHLLLGTITLQ